MADHGCGGDELLMALDTALHAAEQIPQPFVEIGQGTFRRTSNLARAMPDVSTVLPLRGCLHYVLTLGGMGKIDARRQACAIGSSSHGVPSGSGQASPVGTGRRHRGRTSEPSWLRL